MEEKDLERYKQLLVAKRKELLAAWKDKEAPGRSAGNVHGDAADQASAASQASVEIRLQQTDSRLLRAINEALDRTARGAYGICESCGQPISEARLGAVPWTRFCVECKRLQGD